MRAWALDAVPTRNDLPWLLAYALAFWAMHASAASWGGAGFYSLWFPAAGARLALIWRCGPRLTISAACVELAVDTITGAVDPFGSDGAFAIVGVVRPVLAYGLTVAAVRRWTNATESELLAGAMPFGLAAVLAPFAAAMSALPQALWRPDLTGVSNIQEVILSLSAFSVGDLLGTLIVAPPLIWVDERIREGRLSADLKVKDALEAVLVLAAGLLLTGLLRRAGLGLQPTPILLTAVWIGLRFGRVAAWLTIAFLLAAILPATAGATTELRLQLHLAIASVAVAAYLAGSFSDSLAVARASLLRRDRMLFQAERLKTLRAMSVAVIHEISQPLSTLAIEAKHLHEIAVSADEEIAVGAALLDRKARSLSELVRRLRQYGGRGTGDHAVLSAQFLLETATHITAAEAKSAKVRFEVSTVEPDLLVNAQDVELSQALVNLLRNAVHACVDGVVRLSATRRQGEAAISVENRSARRSIEGDGMGVGLLIARAIVEAHGGRLERSNESGMVAHQIFLPLAEPRL